MELRQLEYFVAVAEEASFTKAAMRVHVAQPGVSAQIRSLERDLGQDLLDRSGRRVRLTEAGAAVLPYARAALAAVDGTRLVIDELAGLVRGHVAVGMVTACAAVDLANLLAGFHRDHPNVEITLSEANSDKLIRAVCDGHLDMAWVGLAGAPSPGIETHLIADEALVAAVGHSDPLAAKTKITVGALRRQPLISLPRGTGLRSCLDDACAALGFEPRVAYQATALDLVAQLAGKGLGIALLPESVAYACRAEVHTLAITRPALRSRIELAWKAGGPSTPAARALVAHARSVLDEPSTRSSPAA